MKRRTLAVTATALFLLALPLGVLARGSGNGGCRKTGGGQTAADCQGGSRQRLRDGSCDNADCPKKGAGAAQRGGCGHKPCDATGSQGSLPQGGTGNGAPTGN